MTCYHPLRAYDTGLHTQKTGKPIYKILPESSNDDVFSKFYGEPKLIPCGKCIGCRLDYSRQWAMRCLLEASQYQYNYFVTLTYDDAHIENPSLSKDDLSHFMKLLRRFFEYHYNHEGIRFFACGEYGSNSFRKHLHLILFNCPIPDLKIYLRKRGYAYYNSEILESIWKKGFVVVGDVTFNSAAYVARYICKKQKGKDAKEFYEKLGVIPEFVQMSRKPGIGQVYFEQYKDKIYSNDEIVLPNGLTVKPPKYFDKMMEREMNLDSLKDERLVAAETKKIFSTIDSNLSDVEARHDAERQKEKIMHTLKRSI